MKIQKEKTSLLFSEYKKARRDIKKRLADFAKVPEKDYFYELCFCLLTPQSSAHRCWQAVLDLKKNDFQNNEINPIKHLHRKVRFHNNKSKYLLEWKQKYAQIMKELKSGSNSYKLREYLVKNVKGLGYKEAAHFLRNVGHRDLAILDRHILRNLVRFGALISLPKSLTRNKYLEIEKKFMAFAKKIGIPMDELDLLFWSMQTGKIFK